MRGFIVVSELGFVFLLELSKQSLLTRSIELVVTFRNSQILFTIIFASLVLIDAVIHLC